MTEFELEMLRQALNQSTLMMADVQASHVSIYLTIVFAYIVVAYVAGKQLTRTQLGITSAIFIMAASWEVFMITTLGEGAANTLATLMKYQAIDEIVVPQAARIWINRLMWSSGIFAALFFMWTVRKSKI